MNRNRSIKMRVISDPCIAAWDYARDAHWIYIGNKRRRVTRVRCKSPDAGYNAHCGEIRCYDVGK